MLEPNNIVGHDSAKWLPWLDDLAACSLRDYDMAAVPPTLIVHGSEDIVTSYKQAEALHRALPSVRLELFSGCAHAPQLHNRRKVRQYIEDHVRNHVV